MVNIANPKRYSPSDAKIEEMVRRIVRDFDPVGDVIGWALEGELLYERE